MSIDRRRKTSIEVNNGSFKITVEITNDHAPVVTVSDRGEVEARFELDGTPGHMRDIAALFEEAAQEIERQDGGA